MVGNVAALDKHAHGQVPVIVKICGITSVADALEAANAGADWIGINLWPSSRRYVDVESARQIADAVRGSVRTVGVFVNADLPLIRDSMSRAGLELAQLHGDEPAHVVLALGARAIKVVRSRPLDAEIYPSSLLLFDAEAPNYGGSGQRANWSEAAQLARSRKIMLAGGLAPENVAEAIHTVGPIGVDVASGVERSVGVKDPERMRAFVATAKGSS